MKALQIDATKKVMMDVAVLKNQTPQYFARAFPCQTRLC